MKSINHGNTYHQIFVHIVFAVSNRRQQKIDADWKEELYKYIAGAIKNHNHKLIAIGGATDHVHILIGLNPKEAIADLVQSIKIQSTKWINEKHARKGNMFSWQRGYGAFSYSRSHVGQVIKYINNQEEHHREESLSTEFQRILTNLGIEFDYNYIFEDTE